VTQALIRRASSGDEAALEALFRQHYPPALRLALGLLNSEQDAEEVAQDALAYALTHLDHYDPQRAAFATWLYTITVSRCRNKRRRKWLPTIRLTTGDQTVDHDPGPGPEEKIERRQRDAALWSAVGQLSPKQREAVVLRYAAGLTYPQMSEVLGCSASTAQTRTWLGEQRLRELLPDLDPAVATAAGARNKHNWETIK
jgi:RNA polymerase sigma-70 factor (ECF subfamily)